MTEEKLKISNEGENKLTFSTHLTSAILITLLVEGGLKAAGADIGGPVIALSMAGAALGAMTPDIDESQSKISRRLPFARLVSLFLHHRGVTHSIMGAGIVTLIFSALCYISSLVFNSYRPGVINLALLPLFVAFFFIGYLVHLGGDIVTPSGIPILWPNKKRYKIGKGIYVGSFKERMICLVLFGATFFIYRIFFWIPKIN